jgi:ribosomal protein L10
VNWKGLTVGVVVGEGVVEVDVLRVAVAVGGGQPEMEKEEKKEQASVPLRKEVEGMNVGVSIAGVKGVVAVMEIVVNERRGVCEIAV